TAALGAARSARHLPVLWLARPDDLLHQRPAVPSLPPVRFHRDRRERLRRLLGPRPGHAPDVVVAAVLRRAPLRRRCRRRATDGLPAGRIPARHRRHGPSRQERSALPVPALRRGDGPGIRHGQELRLMLYVVAWPVLAEADDTALRRLRAQYHASEADQIGPHFTLMFGAPAAKEARLGVALAGLSGRRPFWVLLHRLVLLDQAP